MDMFEPKWAIFRSIDSVLRSIGLRWTCIMINKGVSTPATYFELSQKTNNNVKSGLMLSATVSKTNKNRQ